MKKIMLSLSMLFLSFFLVACGSHQGNSSSSSQKADNITVQVIVKPKGKESHTKTVTVKKGDTVMKALKKSHKVEEKDGFITSIDGNKQDEAKKLYWMFKVNHKLASRAADKIKVKKDDKLEFYQDIYK